MIRATLQFELPEDEELFQSAVDGFEYKMAIRELDDFIRNKLKYDDSLTTVRVGVYQEIRDKIYEILDDNNLTIFD